MTERNKENEPKSGSTSLCAPANFRMRDVITPERQEKIETVLRSRTRTIVPVLERFYDIGNVNAVLRTAEALGFQNVHVIRAKEGMRFSKRITHGAHKWLDVSSWDNENDCITKLKEEGYRIATTAVDAPLELSDIDFTQKTAIVFGSEKPGVSEGLKQQADFSFRIPIVGFTESFNVSVAAALVLYHAYLERIKGQHGDLSSEEKRLIEERYLWESANPRIRQIVEKPSETSPTRDAIT